MQSSLSEHQLLELRRDLEARRRHVLEDIRAELLQYDDEQFIDLAERVHDSGEASVADLLSDLDLALIDRHLRELRSLDAALERMEQGTYGVCADCGGEIGYERLKASPTALRCFRCQKRYEETHASEPHPSL